MGLVLTPSLASAQGSPYSFTRVAGSTQTAGMAGAGCVAVNAAGTVLFSSGDGTVWRGDGLSLTPVSQPGTGGQPLSASCPDINGSGDVVYPFSSTAGYTALVLDTGGITTALAYSDVAPYLVVPGSVGVHSLTSQGQTLMTGSDGMLYVMPVGAPAFTVGSSDPPLSSILAGTMNDQGVVAFRAVRQVQGVTRAGVYRGSGVPLVEEGSAAVPLLGLARPVITDAGEVAFVAVWPDGTSRVLSTTDGVAFTDHSGLLSSAPQQLSISGTGTVVFEAAMPGGGTGLFTGSDVVADKVIAPGDSLDGSTVVRAVISLHSINANGQVSFWAELADGRSGVYRANPPLAPLATDGTVSTTINTPVSGTLQASDPLGLPLSFGVVANGSKGVAAVTDVAAGTFTYAPAPDAVGPDTFTFRAFNGALYSNVATVTVDIAPGSGGNHPPVAQSGGGTASAVRFDGPGDELVRTTSLPPVTSFTMMGWFRFQGDTTTYSAFMALGHSSNNNVYDLMRCCGNGWRGLWMWNGASFLQVGTLVQDQWYHLAVTVSGSGPGQVKTYVNGTLALTSDGNPNIPAARFSIGNDSHGEWLDGSAADVKVYDAALSAAEVAQEMQQFAPARTANLNGFYPMQAAATAGADASGLGHSFTATGTLADASGPPVTVGTLTTAEDTPLSGQLQASDPDGNPLTYSVVTNGTLGTVTITNAATGAFTYTPLANASGADTFSFKVNDGLVDSNVAAMAVTISPVNDAPVAADGTATVAAGAAVNGVLTGSDVDSSALTFRVVTNGTQGTATITDAATGAYTYTAAPGAGGTDTFTFQIDDGSLSSNVATVTVDITPGSGGNHPPVAQSGGGTASAVRFDGPGDELVRTTSLPPVTSFTMMGWFRFQGDTTTYSTFMALGHSSNNNVYDLMRCCGNGWRGLWMWNGASFLQVGTLVQDQWYHLAVTVSGSGPGQVKTYVNGTLALTSDGNPNIPAARFSIGNDSHGEWLDGSAADVKVYDAALSAAEVAQEMQQFAPARTANLNGFYPMQAAATAGADASGLGHSFTATGTLADASGPPVAVGTLTTAEDTPLSGQLQASDPDGNPLTYSVVTNGTLGTVTITNAATGAFTYTPLANASGADTFSFKVNDGLVDSNVAAMAVTISPVNDAPVAADGTATVAAGAAVSGVLTGSDVDSSALTFRVVTNGTQGTATITDAATGAYTYTAAPGAGGTDTFTFQIDDGSLSSNVATVTVDITPGSGGNHPPVVQSGGGTASAVRFDGPGDELVRTTSLPPVTSFTMMGWFRFQGDTTTYSTFMALGHSSNSNAYNLLRCCGNGWRALWVWNGANIVRVGTLVQDQWYHLAVTVSGSGPGQVKTYVNGTLALTSDGNPNIPAARLSIGNDSHGEWLDGSAADVKVYDAALSAAEVAQEMQQFAPARTANLNGFYPMQAAATAGADASGLGHSFTATGTLADASGPPVTVGGTLSTTRNTPLNGQLQATDADGDPLTFSLGQAPTHGTVVVNGDGTFVYTPSLDYVGSDSFTFVVSDGQATATGTVSVTVL